MEGTLEHDARARRVQHLLDLGYADPDESKSEPASNAASRQDAVNAVQRAVAEGRLDDARREALALVAARPTDMAARVLAAKVCYAAGMHRDAMEHLDELMYAAIETPEIVSLRGEVLLASRRMGEAIDQLEYARQLAPRREGVSACLGEAYLRVGRDDEAERAFGDELSRSLGSARSHLGLAILHCRRGRFGGAIDHALSVVEADPGRWVGHCWLGVALAGAGRAAEAIVALETAARLEPAAAAPYRWLAGLHRSDPERERDYRRRGRERVRRRRSQRCVEPAPGHEANPGTRPSAP